MSKTLSQLAKLLSASNEQLYDRYINVKLTSERPYDGMEYAKSDFSIVTPDAGIKPSITVTGQWIPENYINSITITIYNMNANIDTMAYNWAEVEVGYKNSGANVKFIGQITNCYMAKPNPNGELVITVACADVSDLYATGAFEVEFASDFVNLAGLITACVLAITNKYPKLAVDMPVASVSASIPAAWAAQEFLVGKATRHFRSPLACIAWINSLIASYTDGTEYDIGAGMAEGNEVADLPPLRIGFDRLGKMVITGTYSDVCPAALKTIAAIGSAVYTSTKSATITAPFNPDVMPGDVVYVDTKYFKTRINIQGSVREDYQSMGNLWWVLTVQFTFSTLSTNTSTIQLNNIGNKIGAKEG